MRFKNRGQKALAAPRTLFFREFWTLLSWRRSLQVTKLALNRIEKLATQARNVKKSMIEKKKLLS